MNTILIDRSLSEMRFRPVTNPSKLMMYVLALREAGVSYFEINRAAAERLPLSGGNYIFRVEDENDIAFSNLREYGYVVLPLRFLYAAGRLNNPIMLEIALNEPELMNVFGVLAENIDFGRLAMLRITGNFDSLSGTELSRLIEHYKDRYTLPLDICARNDSMGALSTAAASYIANTDSVTVCFGSNYNYASLEDFFLNLTTVYGRFKDKRYLSGLCRAVKYAEQIGDAAPRNLDLIKTASRDGRLKHYSSREDSDTEMRFVGSGNSDGGTAEFGRDYNIPGIAKPYDVDEHAKMCDTIDEIVRSMKL